MTLPIGRGRPPRRYTIKRVRLVNFHNFVDETVEVRSGGHLFLLGDNGSGKTTVLDAIHYVLTGGQELEWNAAARIGGRREDGRTLQGVVLRFDPERGVINEGGAIAYAVLELESDEGEPLCLGIGTEATTLDARVVRWGLIRRGSLADLPILVEDGSERRPATRDLLRDRLGKADTFGQMADYRKVVAERLFGGLALYEEVCRFWSMAKSYREIVARARDFGTLFERLLPAPDSEVFAEILASLRAIDEIEVALRDVDAQRLYVHGLVGLSGEVEAHREAAARYRWLARFRELEDARAALAASRGRIDELVREVLRREADVKIASGRCETADEALRQSSAGEAASLLANLRVAEAALATSDGEAIARGSDAEAARDALVQAAETLRDAVRRQKDGVTRATFELETAVMDAAALPGDLPNVRTAAAADPTVFPAARAELGAALADQERVALSDRLTADACAEQMNRARMALERLADQTEAEPDTPDLSAALAAIRIEGLHAQPLYQLLEPDAQASPTALAALEALAGAATLSTLVAHEGSLERVRALVAERGSGLRVIVRTTDDALLPDWADAAFPLSDDPARRTARAALATALAQPRSLGPVQAPDADGHLEHRGAVFRMPLTAPEWLGAEARSRVHRARLDAARSDLARVEGQASSATRRAEAAELRMTRLRAVAISLSDLERLLSSSALETALALEREQSAQALHAAAKQRAAETTRRRDDALTLAEALRARADGLALDEQLRRQRELEEALRLARKEQDHAVSTLAVARARRDEHERLLEGLSREGASRESVLAAASAALRERLPEPLDDESLTRYVRVTQRGDQFRSLDAVMARIREEEAAERSACDELERDGSRGVRHLVFAPRFGFRYERASNRLLDRREQPASGVLAQIESELAEQREVVNERTRRLMDTLVMGQLARHLQEQVERLHRMVRDINQLLDRLSFGSTQYQFVVTPQADRRHLVDLVRRISFIDEQSRVEFHAWIDERLPELKTSGEGVPELLDYRRWFDYRLRMRSAGQGGVELTRELRLLGSGGEQGVPNYLLVLSLAKLMFDNANARIRPLLFDEAFYGIDSGRRDQLLRFATELDLQLFVASPDQDGVTPAVRYATTLFIVKDRHGDVHLAPHHYWNHTTLTQPDLFDGPAVEPDPNAAECRVGEEP